MLEGQDLGLLALEFLFGQDAGNPQLTELLELDQFVVRGVH